MFNAIFSRLCAAEPDFIVSNLVLAAPILDVRERDFIAIRAPGVREDSVGWDVGHEILSQADLVLAGPRQKPHCGMFIELQRIQDKAACAAEECL